MRCRNCARPALFRSRGKKANRRLHADKQHDLCQRCFRDETNRIRRKPLKLVPFKPLHLLLKGGGA